MSYFCEYCNYTAKNSSNFVNHKKTQKHLTAFSNKSNYDIDKLSSSYLKKCSVIKNDNNATAVTNLLICNFCKKEFNHKSNLSRHKKTCLDKNNKDKLINDLRAQLEISEYKMKLEISEKEKELYKILEREKTELLNTFMHNANKIINKEQDNNKVTTDALKSVSMSALKYANEKFKNAPALLPLQNFNINNLDFNNAEDKKQLVEILIYNAKQKSLDKLLGDHIVKQYKKEKPEEQMFHTTDCSRLNYIVRQLMEDALIWSIDKSGIELCTSIIKPLIKKCIDTLLEHQKYLLKEMGNGDLTKQTDVELIISILMSIDSGTLESDINKYIAPYFNLDKSK
jgi:hypothetical protein